MIKVGVISDTHIPFFSKTLPKNIEKYFQGVELILHAGDLVDLGTLNELKKLSKRVEAVCGNMDLPNVEAILPKKKIITVGKYSIGLIHGWGPPKNLLKYVTEAFTKDSVDIIVFGHSHEPYNEEKEGILYFNPGSASDKSAKCENTIGILELNEVKRGKIIKL